MLCLTISFEKCCFTFKFHEFSIWLGEGSSILPFCFEGYWLSISIRFIDELCYKLPPLPAHYPFGPLMIPCICVMMLFYSWLKLGSDLSWFFILVGYIQFHVPSNSWGFYSGMILSRWCCFAQLLHPSGFNFSCFKKAFN